MFLSSIRATRFFPGGFVCMTDALRSWRLGFWSLIATQFQGAFNDNALKYLVIFLIIGTNLSPDEEETKVLLVGSLFALPFILFSMTGGYFADRFSKRSVTICTKVFEIAVMLFAIAGFALHSLSMSMVAVFLASTQGALFGPSKYGLLPEILPEKKLSWGNGVIELGTFLAAISGTVVGAYFFDTFRGREQISGFIFLACSVLGLTTSFGISRVPAADPARKFRINLFGDLWSQGKLIAGDRVLWLAVAGNTFFFFLGALLQFDIVFYARDVLRVTVTQGSLLQASIAIGIGLGSLAAGYLSGGKIEYGLIPLGAIGITVFGFSLAAHGLAFHAVLILLALLGFFGGFFIVPISALIQHRPEEQHRGGVLAAANLLSFIGILAASGAFFALKHYLHLGPAGIFFWSSFLTLAALAYVLWLLPDSLLRLLLWIAAHSLYRLDLKGNENIPARGGVLLTPNHASWVDAVLLISATDRPIRFLMFKGVYDHPLIKPFARMLKIIPIASDQGPREMIHSLREASEALRNGEVVCIFPEGQITRIGQMLPFRRGFERIVKGIDVPIIPVNLDGVWGSIFSYAGGRFFWKWPRAIPYPVRITFGKPLPSTATSAEVRQAVQELGVDAFQRRRRYSKPLTRSFLRTARRNPRHFCMADGRTQAHFWRCRHQGGLSRAPSSSALERSTNGRHPAPAFDSRRARQLGCAASRQSSHQSELHDLQRSARFLRPAVRTESRCHLQTVPRENPYPASGRNHLPGRSGGKSSHHGKACCSSLRETLSRAPAGTLSRCPPQPFARRHRCDYLFQRLDRRTQGRHSFPFQSRLQRRATGTGLSAPRRRPHPRHSSLFSFLRFHRRAVFAGAFRHWRDLSSQSARCASHRRTCEQIFCQLAYFDADFPEFLHAALRAGGVWQLAHCHGRRGKVAGAHRPVV